jgi:hypothetical protein
MKDAIGYLRVSTREQGRSGLGLPAQRQDIEAFAGREGLSIKAWYQDIRTGGGADALLLRPGLAKALKEAKATRSPLIVSRLDRAVPQRAFHQRTYRAPRALRRRCLRRGEDQTYEFDMASDDA